MSLDAGLRMEGGRLLPIWDVYQEQFRILMPRETYRAHAARVTILLHPLDRTISTQLTQFQRVHSQPDFTFPWINVACPGQIAFPICDTCHELNVLTWIGRNKEKLADMCAQEVHPLQFSGYF